MNTSQQSPAAPAAAPTEVNGGGLVSSTPSFEDRAAAAFADDGDGSQTSAEGGSSAVAATPDAASAQRADRRKQLDAMLAQERQRVDAHAQRRANDEAIRKAQGLERERDELRQRISGFVDPSSFSDPAKFFEVAQKHVQDPKALGAWLQKQATNPELIAAEYAQKSIDPKFAALEQQLAQQNELIQQLTQSQQTERATQQAYAKGDAMTTFAQANAAQAPLSARFLAEHGPEEFLKLANSAYAGNVPSWEQHTLDGIEDMLVQLGKIYAPPGATPAKPSMTPQSNGAAKPMTTVSNTLAQTRASVVADEEADWAALPYEERSRRLFG